MTIRFHRLLEQWYPERDKLDWVLGSIVSTQRSAYRKAGAMMLFNGLGQRFGMLSGGCLEGDLLNKARKALFSQRAILADYDLREDSESAWQKGIGCGGAVNILLQPVNRKNAYLGLDQVHHALTNQHSVLYHQSIEDIGLSKAHWRVETENHRTFIPSLTSLGTEFLHDDKAWLVTVIKPAPHILIMGGGADAEPLSKLALDIGWQVSVVDSRIGYAQESHFLGANCFHGSAEDLKNTLKPDAIVIMNHNLSLDAQALTYAQKSSAKFIGLLGPEHRRHKVEKAAGLSERDFTQFYAGPVGLDIGATLPETIALSILSQCHQVIEGVDKYNVHKNKKEQHHESSP